MMMMKMLSDCMLIKEKVGAKDLNEIRKDRKERKRKIRCLLHIAEFKMILVSKTYCTSIITMPTISPEVTSPPTTLLPHTSPPSSSAPLAYAPFTSHSRDAPARLSEPGLVHLWPMRKGRDNGRVWWGHLVRGPRVQKVVQAAGLHKCDTHPQAQDFEAWMKKKNRKTSG